MSLSSVNTQLFATVSRIYLGNSNRILFIKSAPR